MPRRIVPFGDLTPRQMARPTSGYEGDLDALARDIYRDHACPPRERPGGSAGVGISTELIGVEVPDPRDLESGSMRRYIPKDPEIEDQAEFASMREGYLSLPGYYGDSKHANRTRARASAAAGRELAIDTDGLLGQALQHEIDHRRGFLFTDRVGSLRAFPASGGLRAEDGRARAAALHPMRSGPHWGTPG